MVSPDGGHSFVGVINIGSASWFTRAVHVVWYHKSLWNPRAHVCQYRL